jgi:hypothetical protein
MMACHDMRKIFRKAGAAEVSNPFGLRMFLLFIFVEKFAFFNEALSPTRWQYQPQV